MVNHTLSLDMRKRTGTVPPRLTMRRGESQTQKITASLTDNGTAYTPTYQSARLCLLHADGTWARCAATVGTASVTVTLTSDMLNGAGRCRLAYFEFYSSNGYSETTENFELVILGNVDGTTDPARSYDNELDALYKKFSDYEAAAETAEKARVSAESSRVSAEKSRVTEFSSIKSDAAAATSAANTAAGLANSAASEANTAKGNADKATDKATAAASSASEATDTANAAAADALKAAEEARGSISPDKKLYLAYDTVGDTEYLALVDTEE